MPTRDPRKVKALARAQDLYARHQLHADELGAVFLAGAPAHLVLKIERSFIDAIATAIYDAATTGQP